MKYVVVFECEDESQIRQLKITEKDTIKKEYHFRIDKNWTEGKQENNDALENLIQIVKEEFVL